MCCVCVTASVLSIDMAEAKASKLPLRVEDKAAPDCQVWRCRSIQLLQSGQKRRNLTARQLHHVLVCMLCGVCCPARSAGHTSICWSVSTHASPTMGALALRASPAVRLANGLMTMLGRVDTDIHGEGAGPSLSHSWRSLSKRLEATVTGYPPAWTAEADLRRGVRLFLRSSAGLRTSATANAPVLLHFSLRTAWRTASVGPTR